MMKPSFPSPTNSNPPSPLPDPRQPDRLSNLPDSLLLSILSLLSTPIAARTSVFSRRFRHLWEASPSLHLDSRDLPPPKPHNFFFMACHALFDRDPSHPLLSLFLEVSGGCIGVSFFSSLLAKAGSFDLVLGIHAIFSIHSLETLAIVPTLRPLPMELGREYRFPSAVALTNLKTLSLSLIDVDPIRLNQLFSQLCSLQDLHLQVSATDAMTIFSRSIRNLELIIVVGCSSFNAVKLSISSLELLRLETHGHFQSLPRIHGDIPLLRKAVIILNELHQADVGTVARLLNCISHVEELSLDIEESEDEMFPFPTLLERGKDPPVFPHLKHLHLALCFHKHNYEAVTIMLNHCPNLESLKLVHEVPSFTYGKRRKRKDWGSKLPRNDDGNYQYAHFKDLHLEEHKNRFMEWINKKCAFKRKAHS